MKPPAVAKQPARMNFATKGLEGKPRKPKGWKPWNRLPVADPDGLRHRIAEYLDTNGPVHGDDAIAALNITEQQWWEAIGGDKGMCPWFTFDSPGPAGWTLTDRGRAEALSEQLNA